MPDYSNGKIYKIIDESNDDVYIGSTVQELNRRLHNHEIFTRYKRDKQNCKIILIERYPCKSKRELLLREKYHIENNICINKKRPILNEEEHRQMKLLNTHKWKKNNVERRAEYERKRWQYQSSWGGDMKRNDFNNLLNIDPDLFRGSSV